MAPPSRGVTWHLSSYLTTHTLWWGSQKSNKNVSIFSCSISKKPRKSVPLWRIFSQKSSCRPARQKNPEIPVFHVVSAVQSSLLPALSAMHAPCQNGRTKEMITKKIFWWNCLLWLQTKSQEKCSSEPFVCNDQDGIEKQTTE